MRIISLAVDGLETARDAGVFSWLKQQDADVICLQDTRCSEYSLKGDEFFPEGYNAYFWDDIDDHRRNGVAIYCKAMPKAIMTGLGFPEFDARGLYIQADYQNISIGSLLMPAAANDPQGLAERAAFMEQLAAHLQKIRNKRRDFIFCGGWGVAHEPIDAEEAGNRIDIPGFSDKDRRWLNSLYQSGYADAFRAHNSDPDEFTWWPEGDDAGGVRTDTQIISSDLVAHVDYAAIYTADTFSSHAPVIIDYDVTP
ncbi:putative exodeoxyribonuclease [Luminiphilus syltensis NOR5-1B]|uniref:Putative exodeoxyribonuclease n=1 Tax=Luminiphilus syltensis NOR5-1B TaxID=565045 RepID=B8KUA2_9GAMM|nr:exodeoxyribonuclease III [Luminiphilus syltensis]EED36163.1 putative exodeoxyribonuclease [Luminiphilus syltensis NOR5-1B]